MVNNQDIPQSRGKRRQYLTLDKGTLQAFVKHGDSIKAIEPEHRDDRDIPLPEPPPEPPKEWYQSEPIAKTMKVVNVSACVLGVLYAALTFQQVSESLAFNIFYGISSFIMSVPLSWIFTIKLIDTSIRLRKKETLYITAYFMALILAIGTTAAGFQEAKEFSDNIKKLPDWLGTISIILYSFNRFCTRFVGSLSVLYMIFKFPIDEYYKRFTKNHIYYQLLYDIKLYSQKNTATHTLRNGDAINLKVFARAFYQNMSTLTSPQNPGETSAHSRNKLLIKIASFFIISIFIINMQPLWLKLSVEGIQYLKPIQSWGENTSIVWYSALSNEFFYFYMAAIFLPSIASIIKTTAPKIKAKINDANIAKKFAILLGTTLATITWVLSAYYSGNSNKEEVTDAMKNGFGEIADQTWFSWFAGSWTQLFMPVYSQVIVTTSSGLFVNGTATLNFLMEYVSFFKPDKPHKNYRKFDADDAICILKNLIGNHNFARFEKRPGEDIRDSIQNDRDAAKPHQGISSKLFCCKPREPYSEKTPLNRHQSIEYLL